MGKTSTEDSLNEHATAESITGHQTRVEEGLAAPAVGQWSIAALDALLIEMHSSVREGLGEEAASGIPDDQSCARVVGYWLYRLLDCKLGARPPQPLIPEKTIDGPLFRLGH